MTRQRTLLGLILLGYLGLALAYGVVNPLFEAPDEHWHFFTAVSVAETGQLPAVTDPPDEFLGQEAAQPPLAYLLGAALISPLESDGWREAIWLNPYAWIGDASALANVNRMVHPPAEAWPWRGLALAGHALRVFSTLLGLGTLLCIYGSARRLWPAGNTRPLLATALVAFLPQFLFVHASFSNDPLIIFLCSLGLYQLISFWRRPPGPLDRQGALRLAALGLTAGLAALTKNAGILLLAYSLGFLFLLALRDGRRRFVWQAAALVGVPAVLVAGWLWLRNWQLYGDWTATNQFVAIAGGDRGYSLWRVLGESDGLLTSFVAVFGWFNLRPPDWIFMVWAVIAALAILGALICTWGALRGARAGGRSHLVGGRATGIASDWFLALLLAGWPLLVYAGLTAFMLRTEAAQGRLLFPAILSIALGAAWGLAGWSRCAPNTLGAINRRLAPLLVLAALATSIYSLVFVIEPAYLPPPTVATIPAEARRVLPELIDRGAGVSLLAAQADTETARPGETVWLTLYWRAAEPPAEPPEFVLEVFGRQVKRIANLHSYHGRGLYPANLWPPGAIVADRFAVRIDPATEAPVLARIFARIDGGAPGIEVATVKITPLQPHLAPETWQAELGDHIALVEAQIVPPEARPGEIIEVRVRWYVPRGVPRQDYTTLIHLGQPVGPPLSTGDSPPLRGDYPTRAWGNGEAVDDSYALLIPANLSPGRYPVWIGMYDPASGERLPVTVEGEVQPNGVYLAGWIEVLCGAQEDGCDG